MKMSKIKLLVLFAPVILLSGCGKHELENRKFPLAVGVGKTQDECQAVFNFPALSEIANENADGSYTTMSTMEGKDFFFIERNYEKSNSKTIDFSHNKVLIIQESFLEDKKMMNNFMEYIKNQELMARNTFLFVTKMPIDELFEMDAELEKPLGTYLEELLESDEDFENKRIITFGKFLDEQENKRETLFLPVIGKQNNLPAVTSFYVLKRGETMKEIEPQIAMAGNFIQGRLKKCSYEDKDGGQWKISKISPVYKIKKEDGKIKIKVSITCSAIMQNGEMENWREQEEQKKKLKSELESELAKAAEAGIQDGYDLTNSYKKTGNHARAIYEEYQGKLEEYEKFCTIEIEVEPTVKNMQ